VRIHEISTSPIHTAGYATLITPGEMPPKRKATTRGKVLSLSRFLASPESIFNYASLAWLGERERAAPERNDKILTHLEKGGLKLNLLLERFFPSPFVVKFSST